MEFELKGNTYKTMPLDVFSQFHVSRKLMPALIAFSKAGDEEELGDILEPVLLEVAKMSTEDSEYILNSCLSVVFRRDGDKWVKIKPADARILQYADIDMMLMLRLTIEVIKESLGSFFAAVPSLMTGQVPE